MGTDEGGLEEWVPNVPPMITHLEFYLPRDLKLDFSAASLGRLEQVALERFDGAEYLDDDGEEGFVDGVVAYLGEALMRVAGGSWVWDSDSESPAARPDGDLGITSVSPRRLLAAAVDRRDGEQFDILYAAWSTAVEELTIAKPSWRPVKEPTPGLDSTGAGHPRLQAWLAERSAGFAAWAAAYAPDGTWDFSPESLDALEAAVRRVTPTGDAMEDPANRGFLDGAAWYLGEVLCRGIGGEWFYREGRDGMKARPYVDRVGPRQNVLTPSVCLWVVLTDPGFLRERFIGLS